MAVLLSGRFSELETKMIKSIERIDAVFERIEKAAIVVCFSMLIFLILLTIASRNFIHLPSNKIFEAAPAFVLWLSLLGASLGLRKKRHIRLELILRFCPERIRHMAGIAANLSGAIIMGILGVVSVAFVSNEIAMFGPWGRAAVIFPVFFTLSAFRYINHTLQSISSLSMKKR